MQIKAGPLIVTLGNALTVIETVRTVEVQVVSVFVPTTEKVVEVGGNTLIGDPDILPGIHTKAEAPEALRLVEFPKQIVPLDVAAVIVGLALTTTVIILTPVHPLVFPVTVKVVFTVGVILTFAAVAPVLHK